MPKTKNRLERLRTEKDNVNVILKHRSFVWQGMIGKKFEYERIEI